MNDPNKSDGPRSGGVLDFFLMIVAGLVMPFVEGARWLGRKVYGGWQGALRALVGVFVGAGAAIQVAGMVDTWAWLPLSALAWAATFLYGWPLLYLLVVKPVFELSELVWDGVRYIATNLVRPLSEGVIKAVRWMPGADALWTKVLDDKRKNWVNVLVGLVAYPSFLVLGGYFGWTAYNWAFGLVPAYYFLPFVAAVAAGLFVGLTSLSVFWQFLQYGREQFAIIASGVAVGLYFQNELAALALWTGMNPSWLYAVYAGAYLIYLAYAYPLVNLLLTGGLIRWVIEQVSPICEKTYGESDKDYRAFFHHVLNIAATVIAGYYAFGVCGMLGLATVWVWPVVLVTAVIAYLVFYEMIGNGAGNFLVGAGLAASAAWFAAQAYLDFALPVGLYMAIPVGVLTAVFVALVAYPLAYLAVRTLTVATGVSHLGKPLSWVHKQVETGVSKVGQYLGKAYESSYRDRSGYQVFFLHVVNIAAAVFVFLAVQSTAGAMAYSIAAVWVLALSATLLSYLIVGKFLQRVTVGTEFVGGLSAVAAATYVGSLFYAVYPVLWVAVAVGIFAGGLAFGLAFPVVYLAVRLVAKPVFASWMSPLLVHLHDFAWARFSFVWTAFWHVYRALRAVLAPFFVAFAAAWKKVSDAYDRLSQWVSRRS